MASVTDICNRALQKLGAKRISDIDEASPSARAVKLAFPIIRRSELRKADWNFSIVRAQIAADSPAPTWGRANSFQLPSDFIKLTTNYPEQYSNVDNNTLAFGASNGSAAMTDWVIETGRKVLTNASSPLNVRYVADITDTSLWDPIFCEVVSTALALEVCEELTQSNTKKTFLAQEYVGLMNEAKHSDSIEVAPADAPPDTYLTIRN
jgi:hypothetical protein